MNDTTYGASYRRDLDAWVLYRDEGVRIGQIDGSDSAIVEAVLSALRRPVPADVAGVVERLLRKIPECDGASGIWDEYANPDGPKAAALLNTLASGRDECSIAGIWEQARVNHETYSATGDPESDLRFLTLGLCGEAGELANFVKKRWRDGDLHEDDCCKEVADVLAYTMMVAQRLGMTPADLIATVAAKQEVFVAKMAAKRPTPPQGDQQ